MGAQSRTLQQHWRRGITMGDTVRLLSDINSIVDTPQRLQKLEEAKASPQQLPQSRNMPAEPFTHISCAGCTSCMHSRCARTAVQC